MLFSSRVKNIVIILIIGGILIMAVRQYIGARYVPLYVGNWDSTKNYEPLSIVTDGNGNSYTSLKDVPAGTELSNRNYWILTSSFSGAIDQLRRDLNNTNDAMSALDTRLGSAESNINTLDSKIDTVAEQNPNKNRKFILIGDSYASGTLSSGNTSPNGGWRQRFITANNLTLNSDVFYPQNMTGSGNSKFSRADTTLSFYEQLKHVAENVLPLYNTSADEITDIICLGGSNDIAYPNTDILNGIADYCNYARTTFKYAKSRIGVLAGTDVRSLARVQGFRKLTLTYSKCYQYGSTYIVNSEYICANASFFTGGDGTHPTEYGYTEIAKITNRIDCDAVSVIYTEFKPLFNSNGAQVTGSYANFNITLDNNLLYFSSSYEQPYFMDATINQPYTPGTNGFKNVTYTIGTCNSDLVNATRNIVQIPVSGFIGNDDLSTCVPFTGSIKFSDSGVATVAVMFNATAGVTYSRLMIGTMPMVLETTQAMF